MMTSTSSSEASDEVSEEEYIGPATRRQPSASRRNTRQKHRSLMELATGATDSDGATDAHNGLAQKRPKSYAEVDEFKLNSSDGSAAEAKPAPQKDKVHFASRIADETQASLPCACTPRVLLQNASKS